ncbi:polysaccharide deacetylase family protein [bacterium]|nr:MAG: polysaccharide deacetylase family protein [bacterium]
MTVTPRDIITVDVEEWFHGHNYLDHAPPDTWDDLEQRVEIGTARCLDLLDRHEVRATFFVLGWTAERHPDLVREIARRGHEIGCHSYAHPELFKLTAEEFRADCGRALAALVAAGVDAVAGYRAPSFSLTPPVHSYLRILEELGFRYDSSIFPIRHPRYGQPASPRTPFLLGPDPDGLLEIPMPTWRCCGQNLPFSGGGYMRLLPWPAYSFLRRRARAQGQPCVLYVHPWELDDYRPEVGLSAASSMRSQGGQDTTLPKLERLLAAGDFETMGEYAQRLRAVAAELPVHHPA